MPRTLFIIDDDELSREIFALLAHEAGFEPLTFDSGESALAHLALNRPKASGAPAPSALLIDMQLPGLAGAPLAQRLRAACPLGAVLIAISASAVAPPQRTHFDAFLLKPFTYSALLAALENAPPEEAQVCAEIPATEILSQATYHALRQSMTPTQISDFYTMLLADADRRILLMREALTTGDADTWCRAAHAIKGGCGMVGALELASIASQMEEDGPPPTHELVDQVDPFAHFQAAVARLRSILSTHVASP